MVCPPGAAHAIMSQWLSHGNVTRSVVRLICTQDVGIGDHDRGNYLCTTTYGYLEPVSRGGCPWGDIISEKQNTLEPKPRMTHSQVGPSLLQAQGCIKPVLSELSLSFAPEQEVVPRFGVRGISGPDLTPILHSTGRVECIRPLCRSYRDQDPLAIPPAYGIHRSCQQSPSFSNRPSVTGYLGARRCLGSAAGCRKTMPECLNSGCGQGVRRI
jgi:hypothetical protein